MSNEYRQYVSTLEKALERVYGVAKRAREKGLDPTPHPEPKIVKDLAELVEGMMGPPGVAKGIRDLSKKLPREEIAFKIAEEIIYGKFGRMDTREAAEQAIRTALAVLTEGITAAPLQGVVKVAIKSNPDRTKYLAIYFAGPIRSAGGTDQALILVIGDFIRRLLGLDRYKPTEEEIERFIEELRLFEQTVGRFQYHLSDDELRKALQSIPVEVTGIESNSIEVSSFRNLPRIETNRVRGGALRVVNDGVVGRSAKVWTIVEKLGLEGWEWLIRIKEIEKEKTAGFMEDVIAGRPIFSFPSRCGGFRLRYGRARNTGLAAVGIHPASMTILQDFLAVGTQLRVEKPGKAGIVLPVDTIEPPIVRLKDGSVVRVSLQNLGEIKNRIDKILFLGDVLIGFGDFLYNNTSLLPSGFTEEWWCEELRKAIKQDFNGRIKETSEITKISVSRIENFLSNPFESKPTAKEAIDLSLTFGIPLHPTFTYFWSKISRQDFQALRRWLLNSKVQVENETVTRILGVNKKSIKELLEKIYMPHKIVEEKIKIEKDNAHAFSFCLGFHVPKRKLSRTKSIHKMIQKLTNIPLKEKAPTFIGTRMGRPEKAKRREMRPLVHVLFPVGLAGGAQRNLIAASERGTIEVEIVNRRCPSCSAYSFKTKCPECRAETSLERICSQCGRALKESFCRACNRPSRSYSKQVVNLQELLFNSCRNLKTLPPTILKGVKGLINETKTPENLEKGILRARHNLSVYKDGTIRFDATNAPLTHFKPAEIGASLKKLQQLGYQHDCNGDPLVRTNQICELKMQDVVLPRKNLAYFVRVANFLDELLEKTYDLPAYYNVKNADDLVGQLVVGLAPHTLVGILGRIIGFTDTSVCYAHPLWHSAKRRDCDGDEDALMLALDPLLNFSKTYLPARIGGIMDAPLFIIPLVNPQEVQRQAHEMDVEATYPLEFYEKTWQKTPLRRVGGIIDIVKDRLNKEAQFQGYKYSIPVSDINLGNHESAYKKLSKMTDKLKSQLALAKIIEAVDASEVAKNVLTTHFIRDIAGNLRAFTTQNFRCKRCNKRFRRLPLQGTCLECGGAITLTVYRGGIQKYLEVARQLVKNYDLSNYYDQRLLLVQEEINSLFEGEKAKQIRLTDFITP